MDINYSFFKKAQSQPDLLDFCEYLKKPLMVLEDIQSRYADLQINKKVEHENLEIYHKCDAILERHLPEMVDNFCNFSFDYRNNEKIQIDPNTSLTAKELLLKKLAKVIEEIQLIEKDFNKNNSFDAVVHNKVLEQYGYQPELSLETGKVIKNNIKLDNKFDYNNFIEQNQFKKEPVSLEKKEEKKGIQDPWEEVESHVSGSSFVSIVFLGILAVGIVITSLFALSNNKNEKQIQATPVAQMQIRPILSNIEAIKRGIKTAYPKGNYKGLDRQNLVKSEAIDYKDLITPWGETINIYPTKSTKENDSFALEFDLGRNPDSCKEVGNLVNHFEVIKFANYVVKDNVLLRKEEFQQYCTNPKYDFLLKHNITLISK